MIREGDTVCYFGRNPGRYGQRGKVLQKAGTHSHVAWRLGPAAGTVTFESDIDLMSLAELESDGSYADEMDISAIYEAHGAVGLIDLLHDEGRLDSVVSLGVREEPSLQRVYAQLSEQQVDEVVALLESALKKRGR
jgi:hypothetical protein